MRIVRQRGYQYGVKRTMDKVLIVFEEEKDGKERDSGNKG